MFVEPLQPQDWPAVRDIYAEGITAGNATFEMQVPAWDVWDANHLPHCRFVAREGDRVIGWAALSPVSRRAVYAGVAEVSVYVATAAQGRGVGKALLQTLIAAAEDAGIWTLQGSIFPENTASLALHQACGFRIVGRRERIGQRHGVWRDTVLVERRSDKIQCGGLPTTDEGTNERIQVLAAPKTRVSQATIRLFVGNSWSASAPVLPVRLRSG